LGLSLMHPDLVSLVQFPGLSVGHLVSGRSSATDGDRLPDMVLMMNGGTTGKGTYRRYCRPPSDRVRFPWRRLIEA
jgi:hypothetical protein